MKIGIQVKKSLIKEALKAKPDEIYFGERFCVDKFLKIYTKKFVKKIVKKVSSSGPKLIFCLPSLVSEQYLQEVTTRIKEIKSIINIFSTQDHGLVEYLLDIKKEVIFSGSICNRHTAKMLKQIGVNKIRLFPPYLNFVKNLKKEGMKVAIVAHGITPIQFSARCVYKEYNNGNCDLSCENNKIILSSGKDKIRVVGNSLRTFLPICSIGLIPIMKQIGVDSIILESFGCDNLSEIMNIYKKAIGGEILDFKEEYCNGAFICNNDSFMNSLIWSKKYSVKCFKKLLGL